jgi:hypothetical protein
MDGCKAALPLVEKLADGEATATEARDAEAHLALCPGCREHLDALTAFSRVSRESGLPEPPESYWEHLPRRIVERIDSERLARRSFWRRLLAPGMLRVQAVVVTCVLLAAVGLTVFRSELRNADAPPAAAPPARQAPAPAATPEPAAPSVSELPEQPEQPEQEEEKLTAEEPTDLRALGYVQAEPPPIARDEAAPAKSSAGVSAAEKRVQTPAPDQAPSPSPPAAQAAQAPGGLETSAEVAALDERASREESSFRYLKQKEEEPEAHLRSRAAANRALSAEDSEPCAGWRLFLETYGDEGARGADARYELARCSLELHEQAPSDASRSIAIADAEAFLAREPGGPRAEEIRKALERVRNRQARPLERER